MFFLQTNGSGVLSFAGVSASAGQVIQVVTATDSTERLTSSTSFVTASNTLSVSITPSSSSNKILVIVGTTVRIQGATDDACWTIFRGATDLGAGSNKGMMQLHCDQGDATAENAYFAGSILDSPATTSATTYQVYMRKVSGSNGVNLNYGNTKGSITVMEIKG